MFHDSFANTLTFGKPDGILSIGSIYHSKKWMISRKGSAMEQESGLSLNQEARRKIFTTVYAIALAAALLNAVIILYNSIDLQRHILIGETTFQKLQRPFGIVLRIAFFVSIAGLVSGVMLTLRNGKKRTLVLKIIALLCFVSLIVLTCVTSEIWNHYIDDYSDWFFRKKTTLPYVGGCVQYTMFSASMGNLLPQIVYLFILAALQNVSTLVAVVTKISALAAGVKNKAGKKKGEEAFLPEKNDQSETDAPAENDRPEQSEIEVDGNRESKDSGSERTNS